MTSAQEDYIVLTDPSGGLLQNLNFMQYTNLSMSTTSPPLVYQPNPFPYIYETRDYYGNIVTDYIVTNIPQLSVRATQVPYLAINPATNTLFGSTTHGVIVGTNQTYYEYRENFAGEYNIFYDTSYAQYYQALTFDSVGNVYISASSQMLTWFSNLYNGSAASILLKTNPNSNICIEIAWSAYQRLDTNTTWVEADIRGLVVDSLNNLFCVDRMNNVVYKINLDDVDATTPINNIVYVDWEIYADIAFGINGPMDITIDKFDNIYVLSSLTNNIVKITSDKIVTIIGKGLPSNPSQIAYNPADGLLYITCLGTGTLPSYIYKSSTLPGTNSVQYITSNRYVRGIACDNSGNIYYSTSTTFGTQLGDNGDIIIYKVQQTYTTSTYNNPNQNNTFWDGFSTAGPVGNLVYPINSIAMNTANNLYATNFNYVIFSRQFSETDNNVISTGNVWSINASNNTTNYYNGSTSSITINPRAIAINNTNQMYVLNNVSYSTTNILIYISSSNTGTNVTLTNANLLDSPAIMAFDSTGKLYIFNNISNTLCLVTFSAVTTASVTAIPITGQSFSMVNSICVNFNNTYIYVSNNGNNTILQIQLSTGISSILSNSPLINKPTAVYQDPTTQIIYIANHNNAILYFANNTMFELPIIPGTTTKTNANPGSGGPYTITKTNISLKCPSQIIRDTLNNLYIANSADQRDAVVKITPIISQTTLYNSLLNSLDSPADSAYSSKLKKAYIGNTVSPVITIFSETSSYINMNITGTPLPSNPFSLTVGEDAVGNDILYCSLTNKTFYQVSSLGTANIGAVMNITGALPGSGGIGVYIRYIKQGTNRFLFAIDSDNDRILRIDLSTNVSIVFLANANRPEFLTIDNTGTYLYTSNSDVNSGPLDRTIYRTTMPIDLSLNTPIQTLFVTINTPRVPRDMQIFALAIDKYNYLFVGVSTLNGKLSRIYRMYTNPLGVVQLYLNWSVELTERFTSFNYNIDNNSIYITTNIFQECFLAFNMNITNKLGRYNDTLNILHTITTDSDALIFDFSFNVYNKYIVIDPSNIAPNLATNTTFNFVSPNVVPYPTDSYMLQCNGTNISDVFCNNCTYNKSKFIAGTYPTGLVYSNDTNYLYVALQNNTISRISLLGEVDNSYFPPELGLVGPTSLVLDASFDMFVLNAGSDFISYITLRDNIISINNKFFTNIYLPICLTYDPETDLLYLLSGAVPNTRITSINARTGVGKILPIAFGTIYDPNGLTIGAFYGLFAPTNIAQPPNTKYLYVSNTDQNDKYSILRVNLTTTDVSGNLIYEVTTLPSLSGLKYKPFTMTNQNDGFLYVANKNNDSLSKISITGLAPNVEPWAVDGISVPSDVAFDNLGHLFVADSGMSPRNSRISKIYTYDFFFTNVKLTNGTCPNTTIYDITKQSNVVIGYYDPPNIYSFPIPIPYPIGS
jgi:DNA-binding beta-propeller fold protein YncE